MERGSPLELPLLCRAKLYAGHGDVGLAGMIVHGQKVELEPLSVRAGCRGAETGRQLTEAVAAARVELVYDLTGDERWREGEDFAGRTFRV